MLFKINAKIHAKLQTFSPKWLALAVTCSCLSLVFFNLSAIPIAIPSIAHNLQIPANKAEWVINVYFLMFAILILPAGRLTDIFGIRRLMSLGFPLFALGSLWGSVSVNFENFLVGRAFQGMGAALMFPAMGAHLISAFPAGERGKAFGLNTGISSFFWIFGPLISGCITQYFSWRYLMLCNLPITFFGMVMTLLTVPKMLRKRKVPFDYLGALFLALSMGSITVALMQGAKWGWTSLPLYFIMGLGGISTICFLIVTYVRKEPIIDLAFFKLRSFTTGTICACFTQMISMVTVFWALYMQNNLNYSPTVVGGLILLSHVPIIFSSPLGGYLGDRWGVKLPVVLGFLLGACGLIWLTLIAHTDNIWSFIPPLLLFGIGQPLILAPCYSVSMEEIVQNKCAEASGVALGLRQLSLPFGMAMLSALFSFMQEIDQSVLFAFRSVNMMGFLLAIFGMFTAFVFFPRKKLLQI